ncbi:hypothetical protein [Streptomyces nigra]|uniref:hypothetical protein n=1 Tax=Streptomyces nigra TaxID=1827580 RepID=UPI0035D964C4
MTRDGDAFVVRLMPRQMSAMYEALSFLAEHDYRDTELTLLADALASAVVRAVAEA